MVVNVSNYYLTLFSCVFEAVVAGMHGLYGDLGLIWKFLGLFRGGGCLGSGLAGEVGIFL